MSNIELLLPAKDLSTGKTAINHGADAVYIGASAFGARQAAGNSLQDLESLVQYAHLYGSKVHVTVNTLLYDNELEGARKLLWELYNIGVDAVLIQDLGNALVFLIGFDVRQTESIQCILLVFSHTIFIPY